MFDWFYWMPGWWIEVATDTIIVKTPKQELDEGALSWICSKSNSISRMFINKWVSGLGVV